MLCNAILALLTALGGSLHMADSAAAEPPEPIRVAVGFSLQPYVLPSGKGILGELVGRSLVESGYRPEFTFKNNSEAIELFEEGGAAAVTPVKTGMVEAHLSMPVIVFANFAFALADSGIDIGPIDDLKRYRLGGFSNARQFLGPAFADVAAGAVEYHEYEFQGRELQALFQGEVDLIVGDHRIVEYYRRRLINQAPHDPTWRQRLVPVYEFPENIYHVAFHSRQQRDAFDRSLLHLERSGFRHRIIETYRKLLESY